MSKKRKKPNHVRMRLEEKEAQKTKMDKFLNDYMWAITLVVMIALLALAFAFIPRCGASCVANNPGTTNPTVSGGDEILDKTVNYIGMPSVQGVRAADGEQLNPPFPGEEIAIFHTSMGDIKFRLFPEQAPLAVTSFKELVRQGYYDNIQFHRVISGFMLQGGDPTATGMGGESAYGFSFSDEFGTNLYNIRGALSMANSGPNTNGSQFFIVQSPDNGGEEDMIQYQGAGMPEWAVNAYNERGGTPHLDGDFAYIAGISTGHTVFGQVFEGLDVVDMIAAVGVDGSSKPYVPIYIDSAEIVFYG